jgi:hypothetical protein
MCLEPAPGAHPLLTSWVVRSLNVRTRDIDERDRPAITFG